METSTPFPTLTTERLTLRRFHINDAQRVTDLAGERALAESTFLPHPYKLGMAEQWILSQIDDYNNERLINFAIVITEDDLLIGSIGLELDLNHKRGQLGYWVGLPYWNQGYCTEAARAVVEFGFNELELHRICAPHFKSNPASGRVLQKIGMLHEGTQKEHYLHFGKWEDVDMYGMVRVRG